MKPAAYITISWDDGHPLDLRVAELLTKYGLRGTFYIPMFAEHGTMTPAQVRRLSGQFEVGAHTLDHVVLTGTNGYKAWQEIVGSKSWVEDITGQPCRMFCPPTGRFSRRHQALVRAAGYLGLRTVESMSLDFPRRRAGLMLLPTTVQAHPHGPLSYVRNAVKRMAVANLCRYIAYGLGSGWPQLARSMMDLARAHGGVFHLWGHSWELEENGQWHHLEDVLRLASELAGVAESRTNGELCHQSCSRVATTDRAEPRREAIGCPE